MEKVYFKVVLAVLFVISAVVFCNKRPQNMGLKIVSLSPAMTEILFSLGGKTNIVGVTTFCDYPEEAKNLYKVGDFSHPSIERIVGLKPDIVIVNLPEQTRIKKTLEKLNISVFVSSPNSLNDLYKEITAIGKVIQREKIADSLIKYMQANIRQIDYKKKKRVYVELSPRPLVTIGSESFLNELLEMAGGENIFSDLNKEYPVVSQEVVIKRDPEIIILLHPGNIKDRTGWKKITAMENGKVVKNLNQDYLLRPGPRLVFGFKQLKQVVSE